MQNFEKANALIEKTTKIMYEDQPTVPSNAPNQLAKAKAKGFAVSSDDVRKRMGREPLNPTSLIQEAETSPMATLEVTENTTSEDVFNFLFNNKP